MSWNILRFFISSFVEGLNKALGTAVREGALKSQIHRGNFPNKKRINATTFCPPYAKQVRRDSIAKTYPD